LPHTFPKLFATPQLAEEHLRNNGNKPEAFDGDGFSDTPPDPLITPLECERRAVISLNGHKFSLPRRNLMSYYNERRTFTPQQTNRVRWMLRKKLENQMSWPSNTCAILIEAETLMVSDVIVYAKGFGYAQLPGSPFLSTTASRCASVSKPITGLHLCKARPNDLQLDQIGFGHACAPMIGPRT
jgi:hypothetical protein